MTASALKNLVLVHQPGGQDVGDWHEIAGYLGESHKDIEVFIVNNERRTEQNRLAISRRPTFVFSPAPLRKFRPLRGKVYQGVQLPKLEQLRRLAAAGVPVPKGEVLGPGTKLDPAEWGEFVVVKPLAPGASSTGEGIGLMCTEDVRYRPPGSWPPEHPGRLGPMLVQRYVHTGAAIAQMRVLTLFGEPLYAHRNGSTVATVELSRAKVRQESPLIASQLIPPEHKQVAYIDDADVLAVARAAYAALPEAALQGCDILRDSRTGKLYVLEVNPGGNTWHFSSEAGRRIRERHRERFGTDLAEERKAQFDAFRTAARLLAERTRAEAV